jgi:hypothetical protein
MRLLMPRQRKRKGQSGSTPEAEQTAVPQIVKPSFGCALADACIQKMKLCRIMIRFDWPSLYWFSIMMLVFGLNTLT